MSKPRGRPRRQNPAALPEGALLPEQVFARRLREARERRGWSPTRLAARLRELGYEGFHRTTITKIEQGDRRVYLADALVLAAALGVPLGALLVPPPGSDSVEKVHLGANLRLSPGLLAQWLKGYAPLTRGDVPYYEEAFRAEHEDPFRVEGSPYSDFFWEEEAVEWPSPTTREELRQSPETLEVFRAHVEFRLRWVQQVLATKGEQLRLDPNAGEDELADYRDWGRMETRLRKAAAELAQLEKETK